MRERDPSVESPRVGPIIFADETARAYLESEGTVVTVRLSARTTGETHVRYQRTGRKQYDVVVEPLGYYTGRLFYNKLAEWAPESGFGSWGEWLDAIEELNGTTDPGEGWFYRVTQT